MSNDIPTLQPKNQLDSSYKNSSTLLDNLEPIETRESLQNKIEMSGNEVEIERRVLEEKIENTSYNSRGVKKQIWHKNSIADINSVEKKISSYCDSFQSDIGNIVKKKSYRSKSQISDREDWDIKVNDHETKFIKRKTLENEPDSNHTDHKDNAECGNEEILKFNHVDHIKKESGFARKRYTKSEIYQVEEVIIEKVRSRPYRSKKIIKPLELESQSNENKEEKIITEKSQEVLDEQTTAQYIIRNENETKIKENQEHVQVVEKVDSASSEKRSFNKQKIDTSMNYEYIEDNMKEEYTEHQMQEDSILNLEQERDEKRDENRVENENCTVITKEIIIDSLLQNQQLENNDQSKNYAWGNSNEVELKRNEESEITQIKQEKNLNELGKNSEQNENFKSEKSDANHENQEELINSIDRKQSEEKRLSQEESLSAITESIYKKEQIMKNIIEGFHEDAAENKLISENQKEEEHSEFYQEITNQIKCEKNSHDEIVTYRNEENTAIMEYAEVENNHISEFKDEGLDICEQIDVLSENNDTIHVGDNTKKNDIFETNFITMNLEIPESRVNLETNIIYSPLHTDNLDHNRSEANENFENLKKHVSKISENYQDEITRYGRDESRLNETEKSVENKKLISIDKAYITQFSSNAYEYKSNFVTNKYETENDENCLKDENIDEDFLEDEKISEIYHTERDREDLAMKLENEIDLIRIESEATEFNIQKEITNEEIIDDQDIETEQINYNTEIDDVVNYDNFKSPFPINRRKPENVLKFELLPANEPNDIEHTDENQTEDVFHFNLKEKKTNVITPNQLIKISSEFEVEIISEINEVVKTPVKYKIDQNINEHQQDLANKIDVNNERQFYNDYKTNTQNDLLISIDQYKSDLHVNVVEEVNSEKVQQIQESARRQYELLTNANSLETIHEVRSVIFKVETDDEKILKRKTKEIIIIDDEDIDKILKEEGGPRERKNFRKNSLTCVSRLSLKNLKDDKSHITAGAPGEAAADRKFNINSLVESKRSSAKLFKTKKLDNKQLQLDNRLKQISLKIAPLKIPPRPKLIPNSNKTEKAGCFSPKPTKRSMMPMIKEMGLIDLCFVCQGAVVKPKKCKKCNKSVCHVCSFELKDRNKCPDCNCILVLLPKNGGTTTISPNVKKFSISERKSSIFGKRDSARSNGLNMKNKFKTEISVNCCECKDSTIASIVCQKCGKSSCVMCLNSSPEPNKCLSCKGDFKSRYNTQFSTTPQQSTRKSSLNFRKSTDGISGTKGNKKMILTTSTKTFTFPCGVCRKSTSSKNKCQNCPKSICTLCYGTIDGDKTCIDCHLSIKLKLSSKNRISEFKQKLKPAKNPLLLTTKKIEVSFSSKKFSGREDKVVKCLTCKKNKMSCKECRKIVCTFCKKDSFDLNRCSECRKNTLGAKKVLQRISKSDSEHKLLFDDICLLCKSTTNEKISCNNCMKSFCNNCADVVKQNDNKCPNCNNTTYSVLTLNNNNSEFMVNDSNIQISVSLDKEILNEESVILLETKCLICARTPYNNLTCNKCKNEVCFTCTYAMKEKYQCPKCPGLLILKEKKENNTATNENNLQTPKKDADCSSVTNNLNTNYPFSPINHANNSDDKNFLNVSSDKNQIQNTNPTITALRENCMICKGSPIKPKSCTSCYKPVCKMCSYEIADNKCPCCEAELNLVDGLSEMTTNADEKINLEMSDSRIEHSHNTEACLVCKGFPIKPKTCENCNKSVCTICSYELDDPSKCKECKGPYKKTAMRHQSRLLTGITTLDEKKSLNDSIYGNGPSCVVCKRPPYKAKICWNCMSSIFCTPCSFNFEDPNRCLNCQGPLNKELGIKQLNTSRFSLQSSSNKYDGQ